MRPHVEARLEKVKRTSRAARRACFWLMALVSLMTAVMVASALGGGMSCTVDGVPQDCTELTAPAVTVFVLAWLGGLATALAVLHRLSRLFGHYSRGDIFTRDSVREIRMVGYVLAGYAVFQLALFVAWLVVSSGAGLAVPVGVPVDLPIGTVLLASFVTLFSWVMDVGAEIREENELTV